MSSTNVRKAAPRVAKAAARYRPGKAPKGYADVESGSEDEEGGEEGAGEEGDIQLRGIEAGSEDEDEDDGGMPVQKLAKGKSMRVSLKEVDISKEGKVIVAGREESGRTMMEESEEEESDEDDGEAPKSGAGKPSADDESSEYESSSEEEEPPKPLFRPVFVPKRGRITVLEREKEDQNTEEAIERKRLEEEERKKQSHNMVGETIRRELLEKEKEEEVPDIDDTDGLDAAEEFEQWRLRELGRIKREKEDQVRREEEREEVERRRALPEEQRMKEDLEHAKETRDVKPKGQQKFLQKYWHKGAFHQDEEILSRYDYTQATESTMDISLLPQVMQVKNFGKRSRTKYTHLVDQDTTAGNGGFGGAEIFNKKPGEPGAGCFLCGGPHMKKDCPQNLNGPPGTGSNAAGPSVGRSWGRKDDDEGRGDRPSWKDDRNGASGRERSPRRRDYDDDYVRRRDDRSRDRDRDRDSGRDRRDRRDDDRPRSVRRSRSRSGERRGYDERDSGRGGDDDDRHRKYSRRPSIGDDDRGGKRIRTK